MGQFSCAARSLRYSVCWLPIPGSELSTAFITHPDCHLHRPGTQHPESPERLAAIYDRLIAAGIEPYLSIIDDAPEVTREQLLRAHTVAYLDNLEHNAPQGTALYFPDPDTAMMSDTLAAARRAAGAGIHAVDLVMEGEYRNAFCSVRPPGHHAEREKTLGFCFYNNIAIAALHAVESHRLSRVAIVDFDAHHGNGTENIVAGDDRILMVSIFQHPFFPYSGIEPTASNILSVPMAKGDGSDVFRTIVEQQWLPALHAFAPQMLLISAGFDAHREDDMSELMLTETDFGWVTQKLMQLAKRHARERIVSMLEGGYVMSSLARSATEHIRELLEN